MKVILKVFVFFGQGSFKCGDCLEGFFGNQSVGCEDTPGMCPDGTRCDVNADCEKLPGMSKYRCKVSSLSA